jgi:hypothetical protein
MAFGEYFVKKLCLPVMKGDQFIFSDYINEILADYLYTNPTPTYEMSFAQDNYVHQFFVFVALEIPAPHLKEHTLLINENRFRLILSSAYWSVSSAPRRWE